MSGEGSSPAVVPSRWRSAFLPALTLIAFGAAFAIGGVHPPVQLALAAASLALVAAYAFARGKRGLRPVPFAGAAALAVGATIFQLVPLPAWLVGWLSPAARLLRDEVTPGARFMPLTLDAPATWLALARGVAVLSLLIVVGGFVETRRQARRVLGMVAALGVAIAAVALVQRLAGARTMLGFYHPRSTPGFGFYGPFVDVNHAASLLALGALVAAGLAVELQGRARIVATIAATLTISALVLTPSRAALVSFAAAGFVMTVVLASRTVGLFRALLAGLVLMLVGASATLWTSEALRARFAGGPNVFVANQKTRGWVDGLRMATDYRWTGVGRGAFEAPVNAYRESDEAVRLVYPENVLVQMASEWGFPLMLAILALVLTTLWRWAPALGRASPVIVGAACGVAAMFVHELADFATELPGVALPTTIALGAVVGRISADERRGGERRRWRIPPRAIAPMLAAGVLALIGAAWSMRHTLDADYARAHDGPSDPGALEASMARHPADDYLELLAAQRDLKSGSADAMRHLNRALRLHPANGQAHHMAARLLLAVHRPSQAALEYRLAIQYGMLIDLNELTRALGVHVVEAVPQQPARLIELARQLYDNGRPREADAAAARAAELADAPEPMLATRVQLALEFRATAVLDGSARSLLRQAEAERSFALGAEALAKAGNRAASSAALDQGLKLHPQSALLLLTGARLRMEGGDLVGARATLARARRAGLSLSERQQVEELSAVVAEQSGDAQGAVMARARARLIAKERQDMTFSGRQN
ncbi:MAG: hypothetical protein JWN44_3722 [Myxococcales bacterium]|nr:hypothetical protein [Myxococcales bacterium]